MNLYGTKKFSMNETSGVSYNFYISGCRGYCLGCHSDHTHDFTNGQNMDVEWLFNQIIEMKKLRSFEFEHICILGGEPLDHPEWEIAWLAETLKKHFPDKPLWLYTHFELFEVSQRIRDCFDYIKVGAFDKNKKVSSYISHGVHLVNKSQMICKKGVDY